MLCEQWALGLCPRATGLSVDCKLVAFTSARLCLFQISKLQFDLHLPLFMGWSSRGRGTLGLARRCCLALLMGVDIRICRRRGAGCISSCWLREPRMLLVAGNLRLNRVGSEVRAGAMLPAAPAYLRALSERPFPSLYPSRSAPLAAPALLSQRPSYNRSDLDIASDLLDAPGRPPLGWTSRRIPGSVEASSVCCCSSKSWS